VLDFTNTEFSIVEEFIVINMNIEKLLNDEKSRNRLKNEILKEKLSIIPGDFEESLYQLIQHCTALEEYGGLLENPLLELSGFFHGLVSEKFGFVAK